MDRAELNQIVDSIVREFTGEIDDMTLDVAMILASRIREKADEIGVRAVIALSNKGANPVLVHCMDDSYIASYDIAFNKAYTSVALKMSTAKLKTLASPGAPLYGIQHTNQGRIVIFGGGEPLYNKKGVLVGGLGVSGGSEEQDTALAAFGKQIFEKG